MSSTNRGGQRSPADYYPTPHWCVKRLMEETELPPGEWLEPCVGHGSIVSACDTTRSDVVWTGVDLRAEFESHLRSQGLSFPFHEADFTTWSQPACARFDVVITNPPYSIAQSVIARAFELAPNVVMLLRLNYLASETRSALMRAHPPDVYVLPNRPSFSGSGTDSIEYAWFIWTPNKARLSGSVRVLRPTPRGERSRDHSRQRELISAVELR